MNILVLGQHRSLRRKFSTLNHSTMVARPNLLCYTTPSGDNFLCGVEETFSSMSSLEPSCLPLVMSCVPGRHVPAVDEEGHVLLAHDAHELVHDAAGHSLHNIGGRYQ